MLILSCLVHLLKILKYHSFAEGPERTRKIVAQKPSYLSSVDTLWELHWLPIQWHIKLPLSLSKPHIMKFHLISLVFLLLTIHPMFSGHLFLLTSCRSLTLTLLSVLAPSMQLHQRFGIPFLTLSVHQIHLTLSGATWKHTISKLLLISPSGKPQRLWFTCD